MRIRTALILLAFGVAALAGCSQKSSEPAVSYEDKTYSVTPASAAVNAGLVKGEITDMKVTEQVEQGSGNVVSPPKLVGTLKLKNESKDQAVRLVAGELLYLDEAGKPIELEESRSKPTLSFNTSDRLDPGQDLSQSLEVDFPAAALKDTKIKSIRVQLSYLPTPYREEAATFGVVVAAQ